jgi:2,5-diketo-D-gluconate reductase B
MRRGGVRAVSTGTVGPMGNVTRADTVLTVQGTEVPRIGLGTWQLIGRSAREGVRDALEIGYRHIDTARAYGNESEVGAGIAASGVDRGEIFLTTKVGPSDAEPERFMRAAEESLRALDTDYVDLLLLHWPSRSVPLERTLQAFAELQEQQKIRHAGVSNFPARMLERALEIAPLLANQVEYHPLLSQDALLGIVAERDMTLTAYSPLARGLVARDSTLQEIGEEHGKSAGQIALRWLIEQPQVTAVPKASSHERRAENLDVFDFDLTDRDRERIAALPKDDRAIDPSWAPDWDE